jgi:hypothetical protein
MFYMHVLLIFFTGELDLGDSPEPKKTRKVQRMYIEILIYLHANELTIMISILIKAN